MIAFLHTAEVHVGTFTALVTELAPGTPTTHVVDPELLAAARAAGGGDAGLTARLAEVATGVPVLSSPRRAVEAALGLLDA